jgi:MSHA biogenesis protein MshO
MRTTTKKTTKTTTKISTKAQHGFTLLELIMVLVILGVVSSMVAVFIKSPVDAYMDSGRRAAMSDAADTVLRRMARELRQALPNSIRSSSPTCIEFMPIRTGARYRANDIIPGDGSALDFSVADSSFQVLATNSAWPADQQIKVGDLIAVYNLGPGMNDAYSGENTATVSAVRDGAETVVNIAAKKFPLASPANRLHVIAGDEPVVAYQCIDGQLLRRSNHGLNNSCPAQVSAPARQTVLATQVASCEFTIGGPDLQRNSLVQLSLTLQSNQETVRLYAEVHTSNVP